MHHWCCSPHTRVHLVRTCITYVTVQWASSIILGQVNKKIRKLVSGFFPPNQRSQDVPGLNTGTTGSFRDHRIISGPVTFILSTVCAKYCKLVLDLEKMVVTVKASNSFVSCGPQISQSFFHSLCKIFLLLYRVSSDRFLNSPPLQRVLIDFFSLLAYDLLAVSSSIKGAT